MSIRDRFVRLVDRQVGTAKLEERTTGAIIWGIVGRFLQCLAMYIPMTPSCRVLLQRMRGVKIGKNVFIGAEVLIDPAYPNLVTIGDNVALTGRNILLTHSEPPLPIREKNLLNRIIAPILIQNGAWITMGVIVLPGVTIGENSVVSAGSVVTRDVAPYTLVAGSPARVIKQLRAE